MWCGFSWKFHVMPCHKSTAFWSKSTPNSMTIPYHLSKFYLFSMQKHDTDFTEGQVMEFPWHLLRKWWDFHRIWSHFRPNCRQEDTRKSMSHLYSLCQIQLIKKNLDFMVNGELKCPVKNVTWILMEIPYHVISRHNSTWWRFGPNRHQIPCHLSRFYLFSMLKHDMDFT